MSSGYIPAKEEPGPEEVVEALREAVFENPRLREMPAEEVARQLVLEGRCGDSVVDAIGHARYGRSQR